MPENEAKVLTSICRFVLIMKYKDKVLISFKSRAYWFLYTSNRCLNISHLVNMYTTIETLWDGTEKLSPSSSLWSFVELYYIDKHPWECQPAHSMHGFQLEMCRSSSLRTPKGKVNGHVWPSSAHRRTNEACMLARTCPLLEDDSIWLQLCHVSKGTPSVDIHSQRGITRLIE